jgi:hypothetical protein
MFLLKDFDTGSVNFFQKTSRVIIFFNENRLNKRIDLSAQSPKKSSAAHHREVVN